MILHESGLTCGIRLHCATLPAAAVDQGCWARFGQALLWSPRHQVKSLREVGSAMEVDKAQAIVTCASTCSVHVGCNASRMPQRRTPKKETCHSNAAHPATSQPHEALQPKASLRPAASWKYL